MASPSLTQYEPLTISPIPNEQYLQDSPSHVSLQAVPVVNPLLSRLFNAGSCKDGTGDNREYHY